MKRKTRPDFGVESPFILTTTHEQGDRVVQSYRLQQITYGWAGRLLAYDDRPVIRHWAEECWRWWWGHVRDKATTKGTR